MTPLLSIIIVNYNTHDFLKECLDSLYSYYKKEITKGEYEIIVVDNASRETVKPFLEKNFPDVIFIQEKQNGGFAKANNRGIKKSKGKFVLLLNPDTIITGDVLPHMLNVMEKDSEVGIATCWVELAQGGLDDASHRGFPTPWRALCHFTGLGKLFPRSSVFNGYHLGYKNLNITHEIEACCGAFMLIRRKTGQELGWLDEEYFWYGEDLDFCYNVKEKGCKILFVPDVRIMHYKGVASGIKKHSQHIAVANRETKLNATHARFEVMRIFYQKHYEKRYPWFATRLVLLGISIKEFITKQTLFV